MLELDILVDHPQYFPGVGGPDYAVTTVGSGCTVAEAWDSAAEDLYHRGLYDKVNELDAEVRRQLSQVHIPPETTVDELIGVPEDGEEDCDGGEELTIYLTAGWTE